MYGSPKESSGSTPSESSGSEPIESSGSSGSLPDDESSSGSSGYGGGSSSVGSGSSGASEYCAWEISLWVLYDTKNGEFTISNTGTVDLNVTNINPEVSDYLITPDLPQIIAPGASLLFSINTVGGDLTGAYVLITTSCGENDFQF